MRNNGFMTGIMAGAALGALMVLALSPQVRGPVMQGAGDMGDRMRKMWRRTGNRMEELPPGDVQ